ncbi:MAG: hypothetical protein WAN10_08510 [Candidatus Acidiferrales bacterium]
MAYPTDASIRAAQYQQSWYRGTLEERERRAHEWFKKRSRIVDAVAIQRNDLRLEITIRSRFGEQVLRQVHRDLFTVGFDFKPRHEDNGDWSSKYEYVDPVWVAGLQPAN